MKSEPSPRRPARGAPADPAARLDAAALRPSSALLLRLAKTTLKGVEALDPLSRARALQRVALACDHHFRLHNDAASADAALLHGRAAVAIMEAGAAPGAPAAWAADRIAILDTLANVFLHRGVAALDPAALDEAEGLFTKTLGLIDRRTDPGPWCTVANSLASVHANRHRIDGGPAHHAAARAILRAVRSVAARGGLVAVWADAAGNMLRMARDDAAGAGDAAALAAIVRNIRRVLKTLLASGDTRLPVPLRHLLAVTLTMSADVHYSRAALEEARDLWRLNLAEWPRARSEQEWARYSNSLGLVETTIGEKESSRAAFDAALALFATIGDFPSLRRLRARGAPRPPWRVETTPENYLYVLTNIAGVREQLATMTRSPALIYDTVADLEDLGRRHRFHDRSLAAMAKDLLARAMLALARMVDEPVRLAEAERLCFEAAAEHRAIGEDGPAAVLLAGLGEVLEGRARWPDALKTLARAETALRAACAAGGPDEAADGFTASWRLLAGVRLRRAAWQGDAATAAAVLGEVEAYRQRLGPAVALTQDLLLDALGVDGRSVVARLTGAPAAFDDLTQALLRLLDRPDLPPLQALPYRVALGHALKARGRLDEAITTWTAAQATVWRLIVETGEAGLNDRVTCAVGRAGRDLMAGGGLSLADELAMVLLRRDGPGDVDRALVAIEGGRAIAPSLHRGEEAPALALRDDLRQLEAAERQAAAAAFSGGGEGARLGRLGHRKRQLQEALAQAVAGRMRGGRPAVDRAAILSSLPEGAALAVVVLAERDGGLVLLGRDARGTPRTSVTLFDGLDRGSVDRLLAGDDRAPGGLLGAIEALQGLGEAARPTAAGFRQAVEAFSHEVTACEAGLGALLDPVPKILAGIFGGAIHRLCWLLPGPLWPLPLHAMQAAAGTMPPTQSYGRTLGDVEALARRYAGRPPGPRRALVVDDPRGDMQAPCPFSVDAAPGGMVWRRVGGRSATPAAILKAMAAADLFLFHGHGNYVRGDRDRTGLIAARSAAPARRASGGRDDPGILSINAIGASAVGSRDLAVLSACDVGGIDLHAAIDDFSGMAAALLDAGFCGVVAATWPVEQGATARLMRAFIADLVPATADPAAALARAAAAVRGCATEGLPAVTQRVGAAAPADGESAPEGGWQGAYWWGGFRFIGF